MLRTIRKLAFTGAFLYDTTASAVCFLLAFSLRLESLSILSSPPIQDFFSVFFICVATQGACFMISNLYRGIWKFSSIPDLARVISGSTLAVVGSLVMIFLYNRLENIPRSFFFIDWALLIMALGGGRFYFRLWEDSLSHKINFNQEPRSRVLIVGTEESGSHLIKEIQSQPYMKLNIVGLIDRKAHSIGRSIMGVNILGHIGDIERLAKKYKVKKIFIALSSGTRKEIKEIVNQCKKTDAAFKILPLLNDRLHGEASVSDLRNVTFESLLGREPVELDVDSIKDMILGKTILVTGAGGSIGRELCYRIARYHPRQLICFEITEFFLYELENKLRQTYPQLKVILIIGDVRNRSKVSSVLEKYSPNIVLHTAAYKHVPIMEDNPMEAIETNVKGTLIMAEEASHWKVNKFVMVSTDKAVNPTSIMGSTKRIAEMICQHIGENSPETQYMTVRFGNVIGSNGSIVPLFRKQIENNEDLTVTHPEIERYFMSISEAAELILQTATMGKKNDIFILNMGKPIKILDMAKEMIELSNLKLGEDINIKFIGLRPGEKLYEELFTKKENFEQTTHKKIYVAKRQNLPVDFENYLKDLINLNINSTKPVVLEKIKKLVTEFHESK